MFPRELQRILVVLADLLRGNALFEAVVARQEQVVDLLTSFVRVHLPDTVRGRMGSDRVRVVGRVAHDVVPRWLSAADVVCGPALVEPFGQALLEAMACERSVVATRIGGPPEFVTDGAGVLVDPLDTGELARALEVASGLPSPNPAARAAAAEHDVRRQAERVEEILQRAVRGRRA